MTRPHPRTTFAVSLLAASLSAGRAAHAQGDSSSRALAVEAFDRAEDLFANGQTARACPKYAESFRLDPQLGVLIYMAECYEKNGQIASAWGSFRAAEEMAEKRGDERRTYAHERAAALSPRVDHLRLVVPPASRVPGLEILIDGLPIAATLWDDGAAVDAATHHIEARARGYQPWKSDVQVVGEGKRVTLEVPKLALEPRAGPRADAAAEPGTSRRIAAIAVGGVGLIGLGVSGFFGLSAQASYSDSKSLCNDDDFCTARGVDLRDSAKTKAAVSTIAGCAGIAALGVAAVLWFSAPSKHESAPRASAPRERGWAIAPSVGAWGIEAQHAF